MHTARLLAGLFAIAPLGVAADGGHAPRIPLPVVPQIDDKVAPSTIAPATRDARDLEVLARRFGESTNAARSATLPNGTPIDIDRREELHFDTDESGTTWVRGRAYKARFDERGMKFKPIVLPSATRDASTTFFLSSARVGASSIPLSHDTGAVREGERVSIDRGPIDEVYEVRLEGVEQTFVVEERPFGGDLVLFVGAESALAPRHADEHFEFADEHGGLRYERAFVREADGAKTPVPTRLVDGGIEIRVPESVLARAEYPLVVDPWIVEIGVNLSNADNFFPDVAYDVTTDTFLIVYEEYIGPGDHDTRFAQYNGGGGLVRSGYIDLTDDEWWQPEVANLNAADQFLVVSSVKQVGSTNRAIRGRTIQAASGIMASQFTISGAEAGDKVDPDIGGDSYTTTPSYYCVVWTRQLSSTDFDIHARIVAPSSSTAGPTLLLSNSSGTIDSHASIAKSNGGVEWPIVFSREESGSNHDTYGARVRWSGAVVDYAFPISIHPVHDTFPTVSSILSDGTYMVAWEANLTAGRDIWGVAMRGATVVDSQNLTQLSSGPIGEDQMQPTLDSGGSTFVLGYAESYEGSTVDYDVYGAQFMVLNDTLALRSAPDPTVFSYDAEVAPSICSRAASGGAPGRFVIAWTNTAQFGTRDIKASIGEFPFGGLITNYCFGDGSGTPCPCGPGGIGRGCPNSFNALGALLTVSGSGVVGDNSMLLSASGMPTSNAACWFFQGTSPTQISFGDGLRCAVGTLIRLGSKITNNGAALFPGVGDPSISTAGLNPPTGGTRYYQVSYRNSLPFCTPATFNMTNGVRVDWLPD